MSGEPRLGPATLDRLPHSVRRPGYDRTKLEIGMAHVGVGAFHRCHQAEYTDDALEAEFGPWGEVGINLRPPRLGESLAPQDGLYLRTLRHEDEHETRLIGCLRETVDAEGDGARAAAALAAPRISIVTLTVTEKGYCHLPATGHLDPKNADIVADLTRAPGAAARSLPGVLTDALARRRATKAGGLTLVSCDNIPANGRILANVVTEFARHRDRELAEWIADHVRFPSTMVDRIVPATTGDDLVAARAATGVEDRATVVGERFRQWVIEDDFLGARPRWEVAGAQFVTDVEAYELTKMRLLNGAQTAMCYLGALVGLDYTFEDVRDPAIAAFVRGMLETESAPTLPHAPGMEPGPYIELTFARLRNSAIRHRNHQIATDGSQKIVQRALNPIRDRIARGASHERLAAVVAAWLAYLMAASPRFGARWTPSDPWAERVRAIADHVGPDAGELARQALASRAIFGADLAGHDGLRASVARHLEGFLIRGARRHLESLLAAPVSG